MMGRKYKKITKYNLLPIYHSAHQCALTPGTICASFRKTGIWPFDPTVIPSDAFEPALNTTTQAAQPVPTVLSSLLEPIPSPVAVQPEPNTFNSAISSSESGQTARGTEAAEPEATAGNSFRLVDFPPHIPGYASREALLRENDKLRAYCHEAKSQMEADHASKQLMDAENQRLRNRLFDKTKKPTQRREGGSSARHMTSDNNVIALVKDIWKTAMVNVHKQIVQRRKDHEAEWHAIVKLLEVLVKKINGMQKVLLKEVDAERRRAEKEAENERRREDRERKTMEQATKKAETAQLRRNLREQKATEKAQKAADKAAQKAEREAAIKAAKALQPKRTSHKRKADSDALTTDENMNPDTGESLGESPKRPRPRPRPLFRPPASPIALAPVISGSPADLPSDVNAATILADVTTNILPGKGTVVPEPSKDAVAIDPALMDQ
jgi:hypothetical protein